MFSFFGTRKGSASPKGNGPSSSPSFTESLASTSAAMATETASALKTPSTGEFVRVTDKILGFGERIHVKVPVQGGKNRYVTVLNHHGVYYAIDSTCYHAGGPLGLGDIEDHPVMKEPCITCPWHTYTISLQDGSKLYQGLEMGPDKKLVPSGWKKTPNTQRIHQVEAKKDGIYVCLTEDGEFNSDEWGTHTCGEHCATGDKTQHLKGRDGSAYKRSGHVLSGSSG